MDLSRHIYHVRMDTIGIHSTAVEALDAIMAYAVERRASDIHIDPMVDRVQVRLRVDGLLEVAGQVPTILHDGVIARLKILSGARTDVHAVPQDGRWRATIADGQYNIRVSFMPSYYGENAVLRLLPAQDSERASFETLGFSGEHAAHMRSVLSQTSGLILIAGPTGSGKTTTLRACLMEKTLEPLSIMTLEDPVEYEIPGVRQIHIRHEYGVTFASGLRSALRQDPDVIMVGEIRDGETANVAIHTALTGHLVLSTIHTNSAPETILRLIDMGVDPYLLASTLTAVVAQRLVRTVCSECQGTGAAHEYDGAQCNECRSTGWKGRSVISEVLVVDAALRELICRKAPLDEFISTAQANNFAAISIDGAKKVSCGLTTALEVARVSMQC